ncbi:hypothetical protein ACKURG_26340, partial [Enterobacter roggenkampii]
MMNPVPWLQMTNMISYQGLVRTFPRIRKIKSILLNERFKSEYDEKLISYLINNGDSSRKADEKKQSLYIEQIKNLDNGELHNSYIYAAFFLLVLNFSLSLVVST